MWEWGIIFSGYVCRSQSSLYPISSLFKLSFGGWAMEKLQVAIQHKQKVT
jgi:hypothetical protein